MNPLVIIKSAHRHASRRDDIRRTWLRGLQIPYVFALGRDPRPLTCAENAAKFSGRPVARFHESDAQVFNVDDGFANIAPKLHAAILWGANRGYDGMFVVDDDTYVAAQRLHEYQPIAAYEGYLRGALRSDSGFTTSPFAETPYIQGSAFYLGWEAIRRIIDEPSEFPTGVPDDVALGKFLYNRMPWASSDRFHVGPEPRAIDGTNNLVTTHKCVGKDMYVTHNLYHNSLVGWNAEEKI